MKALGEINRLRIMRLVLKEQKVDELDAELGNHPDPELFTITARIKDRKDIDYVRDQILAELRDRR